MESNGRPGCPGGEAQELQQAVAAAEPLEQLMHAVPCIHAVVCQV